MDHNADGRSQVFASLRGVALPDSRFHFDFGKFMADFQGSEQPTAKLLAHSAYQNARRIFITPDNCSEELRH